MDASHLTEDDRRYLARAVDLGRKGWGGVHPNPLVGCVLVRNGEVVGEGWHEAFGGPHAEVRALDRAGTLAAGATAYVSLEPCRHEGKTPACTGALLGAGVARVVYGAADPGGESGGGGAELRSAGLTVLGPVFDDRLAWSENPTFFQWARQGTPHVAVKLAFSLDGAVAAAPGERTQLTGPEARREVHRLRSGFDAIMVGGTTARVDNPLLTVRDARLSRPAPVRVVLDSRCALPDEAALLRDVADVPVWVFCREDADELAMERLERAGAHVHPVPAAEGGSGVELTAVLEKCGAMGVRSILCEGGGVLASALIARGTARRLYALVAPTVLGSGSVPAFPGLPSGVRWSMAADPVRLGDDTLLTLDRAD